MHALLTQLDRCWRWLATGAVVVLFGIGAIVVSLTVFPLLRLLSRSRESARPRIQRAMHLTFRAYVKLMRILGLLTCEVQGRERLLQPGQLVIANHPTLLDVVLLVSLMPEVDCIVKEALWRHPFLRWPVLWASYIPNRSGEQLVAACAATLRQGRSLLVFPEGTRSWPGRPLHLQRGVAHIALEAAAPILPVTIEVSEPVLTKTYPWYRVPRHRPHFRLLVGEPWPPVEYNPQGASGALPARTLTRRIGTHYAAVEARNLRWPEAER